MQWFKEAAAAVTFLTLLPIPLSAGKDHLSRSLKWFPLAGLLAGALTGGVLWGLGRVFPPPFAAAAAVAAYLILTRGLHLDGFMDTLDGFLGGHETPRILEIMKDPRIGAFAAAGTGVWLLLLSAGYPRLHWSHLALIHMSARTAILMLPLRFPYVRESGTGAFFARNARPAAILAALALWSLLAAGLGLVSGLSLPQTAIRSGAILGLSLAAAFAAAAWARRKIGGVTGDVFGFAVESAHLLGVAAFQLTTPWSLP